MAEKKDNHRPHLFPTKAPASDPFTSPRIVVREPNVPRRARAQHGAELLRQLQEIRITEQQIEDEYRAAQLESSVGLQIEFSSFLDAELLAAKLADERKGIELANVREGADGAISATVWVPQGALVTFENKVQAYIEERRNGQRAADHRTLVDAIQNIRTATFEAIWTDDDTMLPQDPSQIIWWELWLPNSGRRQAVLEDLRGVARNLGMDISRSSVVFPERTIVLIRASRDQLQHPLVLSLVSEIRRARDTAEFFDRMPVVEQAEWSDSLLERVRFPEEVAPVVCILDTGVNRGHPLLQNSLSEDKVLTVDQAWGVHDGQGHGTELAGLALYGDLQAELSHELQVHLTHQLESVKILRSDRGNEGEEFGSLTIDAVAQPEARDPERQRIFCMAITSEDGREHGRPSAWSATIDRLASDWINDGETRRLFCISAGNIQVSEAWLDYPANFERSEYAIESPGQSWNALTVGAYTNKHQIDDVDAQHYQVIAPPGELSPFTSTSLSWEGDWPWKPDIVLEGGNAARDGDFASNFPSLSLLTTHFEPVDKLFTVSWATSAATALASQMAAQILAIYPDLWPETVRALMVHSARWTAGMLGRYCVGATRTQQNINLLRHCGYGAPDITRALWSVSNSLTLIVQETIQPFARNPGENVKTHEMHLHDLPWPQDMLEALGETPVKMRVTLSYFIEPNPGERGFKDKYSYQSHGLRFDVRRRAETEAAFKARINRRARDADYAGADADQGWILGDSLRRRGSLHSDVWEGTAAELANRGQIAVYPSMGWWKTRPGLQRFNQRTRYALTVSIEAPGVEQDIYAEVEAQILPLPVLIQAGR